MWYHCVQYTRRHLMSLISHWQPGSCQRLFIRACDGLHCLQWVVTLNKPKPLTAMQTHSTATCLSHSSLLQLVSVSVFLILNGNCNHYGYLLTLKVLSPRSISDRPFQYSKVDGTEIQVSMATDRYVCHIGSLHACWFLLFYTSQFKTSFLLRSHCRGYFFY